MPPRPGTLDETYTIARCLLSPSLMRHTRDDPCVGGPRECDCRTGPPGRRPSEDGRSLPSSVRCQQPQRRRRRAMRKRGHPCPRRRDTAPINVKLSDRTAVPHIDLTASARGAALLDDSVRHARWRLLRARPRPSLSPHSCMSGVAGAASRRLAVIEPNGSSARAPSVKMRLVICPGPAWRSDHAAVAVLQAGGSVIAQDEAGAPRRGSDGATATGAPARLPAPVAAQASRCCCCCCCCCTERAAAGKSAAGSSNER